MTVRLLHGDCRDVLRTLPDDSVHCCVTSPPYWGLRSYLPAGHPDKAREIGSEPTVHDWVQTMVEVFREVRRVLRPDGTLWLNLGDSYATRWSSARREGRAGLAHNERERHGPPPDGFKNKGLIGQPWRVAFALQADGWWLRQELIWSKANPMPESVTDRFTKAHEQVFLLSKSERYYFDMSAVMEPAQERAGRAGTFDRSGNPVSERVIPGQSAAQHRARSGNKERKPASARGVPVNTHGKSAGAVAGSVPWEGTTRQPRSVRHVATKAFSGAHYATYPPDLIRPFVLAGCPEQVCGACGAPIKDHPHADESVPDLRQPVQVLAQREGSGEVLRQGMRDGGEAQTVGNSGVQGLPQAVPAEQREAGSVLQSAVRIPMDSEEPRDHEGLDHHLTRLQDAERTDASEGEQGRVRDGAPAGGGAGAGSSADAWRSGAPHQRRQAGQPAQQSGGADEGAARQIAQGANGLHSMPALPWRGSHLAACPRCRASLSQVGVRAGVCLDPFGGSGTTGLVADQHGRNAILIDIDERNLPMARERISGDAPLFSEVAA